MSSTITYYFIVVLHLSKSETATDPHLVRVAKLVTHLASRGGAEKEV